MSTETFRPAAAAELARPRRRRLQRFDFPSRRVAPGADVAHGPQRARAGTRPRPRRACTPDHWDAAQLLYHFTNRRALPRIALASGASASPVRRPRVEPDAWHGAEAARADASRETSFERLESVSSFESPRVCVIGSNVFGDRSGPRSAPAPFLLRVPRARGHGQSRKQPEQQAGRAHGASGRDVVPRGVCATAGRASRSLSARARRPGTRARSRVLRPPDTHLPLRLGFGFGHFSGSNRGRTLPCARAPRALLTRARRRARRGPSTYAAVPGGTSVAGGAAFVTPPLSRERSRAFNRDLSREDHSGPAAARAPPAPGASPAPPRGSEPPPFLFRRRFFFFRSFSHLLGAVRV